MPISVINSDRICGTRVKSVKMTTPFFPCIDQGVDFYREHLVSESWLLGLVAVLGDFNGHLGLLEG